MRPKTTSFEDDPLSLKPLLLLTALGVGLRAILLLLSGEPELQSDEANYVYLALAWNRFGIYFDQHRYLWPPGYTWYLGSCLEHFGDRGLFAARSGQVLASASVGLTTMLFAYRFFGMRAARLAGMIWMAYLPLAVFTHLLWNETLFLAVFLPAVYQVHRIVSDPGLRAVDARVLCAGLSFAAALCLKEWPFYLIPIFALCLVLGSRGVGEGLRRASLMLLTVAAALLPWGLRNREVYGRFVPVGASLGENVYNGLNADYRNFDLVPLDTERFRREEPPVLASVRPWFIAVDQESQWDRADEVLHTIDRSDVNVRRGMAFARERPGWLVRSRIKKIADLVTPMSFYTRHLALGHYDSSVLGSPIARKLTGLWALACPIAVLLLAAVGYTLALRNRAGAWIGGIVIAYGLATGSLVAMSRFRTPMEPFLIVLAAGAIATRSKRTGALPRLVAGALALCLFFLWWVDLPEVWTVVSEMVWRRV